MADTIDSISIELTASTESAERSIQRVINMLGMLQAAAIDASTESRIGKSIRSIAKAAREIDSDAGQKLARLAGGLKALSKVGDLSNLADAGKNLSGVVRTVNSMGQTGGNGLSNLADGIKQTNDALGGIKDADVSKLGAVRDALSGEMSGSLHQANQNVIEHPALGGSVAQNYDMGLVNPAAVSIYERIAQAIGEATSAHREFRAEVGSGGGIAGLLGEGAVGGAIAVFTHVADSIRDATAAYREFQAALGSGVPPIFTNFADGAAQVGGSVRMLTGSVGSNNEGPWVADEIRDAARAYDDLGNSASRAADVIETEFVNPFANFKMKPLEDELPRVTLNPIDGSVADSVNNAAGAFGNLSSVLGGLSGVLGPVASGLIAIPKYFGGQLIGNIQKATKGLTGFFHSIVRIAKYRLIRAALRMITQGINEGIKNLYAFSQAAGGTFASSMNQIATASKYLGNSFAAMASPLVEALAPAIDFVVDKFVDMFNTISQIIARLTGKTSYTAAKKVAAQWGDAASSASSSANEAADEIKRSLMGFDEINKLNDIADSAGGNGGGGGGSGGGGSSAFEELPIDGEISSFADSLKAAFEAGHWQELGTLLGNKVNELVDSIDWAGAGTTVGYYINGWFSTKYWTLDTINFTNIGSKIAEFLNNAIAKIDFSIIGASLVQKLTIIGDLIIGFFSDFDFGQAADKFSDFVKGIYNEISKWLDKYDWGDVGNTIYTKLKDALTNLDLSGIATSFVTALGKAIKAVVSAGAGFLAGFWADVTAYWDEHIKADDFTTTVHNILDAIGQGFSNLGEWVWNSIIKPFGAALTGNENWDTELLDVGKNIIEGIFNGIVSVISGVGTWIKTNIFDPFLKWLKSVFGIASPAKTMEEPGENIVLGIFQGIINALKNVGQWVKENIFDPIWGAISAAGATVIEITVSLVKKVGEWASDVWDFLQNTGATIAKKVTAAFEAAKSFAGDVWDFVKTGAQTIVKTVNAIFTEVGTWAGNVWDAVKAGAETIVKEVKAIFTEVGTWAGNVWDAVKAGAETIVKTVKAIFTEVGTWAGNVWDAVKSGAETIIKEVKAIFTEVGEWAGNVWTAIKNGAETIVKEVKAIFTEVGTWAGNVWNAVKAGAETIVKTVNAIFSEVGTWAGNVWDTVKAGTETIVKTVEAGMEKAASWVDSIVDFILGPESADKKANISMAIENTALAIVNFLRDPVTAIKNVMLELGVKFAQGVEKFWNWITGSDGQSEVVVDAYGNFMLVPKAGEGLTDNGNGQFALTNDVAGTTVLTPEKSDNWEQEWDKLVGDDLDLQVKLNVIKGTVDSAVQGVLGNAGKTLTTTVSTVLQKAGTWVNDAWTAMTTKSNNVDVKASVGYANGTNKSSMINLFTGEKTVNANGVGYSGTNKNSLINLFTGEKSVNANGVGFAQGTDENSVVNKFNWSNDVTATGATLKDGVSEDAPLSKFHWGNYVVGLGATLKDGVSEDAPLSKFHWGKYVVGLGATLKDGVSEDAPLSKFHWGNYVVGLGATLKDGVSEDAPLSKFHWGKKVVGLGAELSKKTNKNAPLKQFSWGKKVVGTGATRKEGVSKDSPLSKFTWTKKVIGTGATRKSGVSIDSPLNHFNWGKQVQATGAKRASGVKKTAATDLFDKAITITATLSSTIHGLSKFVKTIVDAVKEGVEKVGNAATGGVIKNGRLTRFAYGGIINNGFVRQLPHYAGGSTDAHGTLFVAGEAGPEILGHIGGRTEILNQSQLAQTMFAAVRSAMTGVKIGGYIENAVQTDNGDADYETMYRAMYDAFTDAMTGSNERDKEKVQLMRQIAAKEFTAEVTAASMAKANTRMNRRAGTTIVPVGT